jgi:hypothetical protein
MKCEEIRSLMMDYLYNELSEEDRDAFISHLAICHDCRKVAESLKTVSNILQQWEDVDTEINIMPFRDNRSWILRLKDSLSSFLPSPGKMSLGLAYGLAAIFLVLSVASTEISFKDGNFKMSMGFLSRPEQQENQNDLYVQGLIERLFNENIRLTSSLIQENEARQRKVLAYFLTALQKDFERQRYQDLNLVGYGLESIQKSTNKQIQQIDYALTELMRPDNDRY